MEQEDNKKEYEIAFLLKEEENLSELISILKQHEAEISFQAPIKKILLAYEIKKQTSAHFGVARFSISASRISELESALNLRPFVLRFLIIKFVPGKISISPNLEVSQPAISDAPSVEADKSSSLPSESVKPAGYGLPLSNEDLEKRIEEILK